MKKIIVIGSSNTDMVIKTSKLPAPGETVLGGNFLMNAGGKGANQAVAAARLGGKTVFVCKVGNDVFGKQAIMQFEQEGMDTSFVFVDDEQPSGVALINVDAKGENAITVASGANANLSKIDIDQAESILKKTDILLIQLETPLSTVEYTIKKAFEHGLKVILNPAPAAKISEETYQYLFAITPNETETELLTGIKIADDKSLQKAANWFINKGVKTVIITLGSKGAYIESNNFKGTVETPKVNATDTTAAGDCFNGALAVALSEEMPIEKAVAFACKAASISVTRMGAQASMPFRKEL